MEDRRTTYSRLREMLSEYSKSQGPRKKEISFAKLETLIIINIGSAPRTIREAMHTMVVTNLLEDIGNARFRIVRMNLE